MHTRRFLLALAGAAGSMLAVASAANADIVVYPRGPVYVAPPVRVYGPPPARVYVGPAGAVRVGPACVTRTVRVWNGFRYVYRTVTRC